MDYYQDKKGAIIFKLCDDLQINSKHLSILITTSRNITSECSLFGSSSCIRIPEKALKILTFDEFIAIVGHELFHIAKHGRSIKWMHLASAMLLFPNPFMLVFLDLRSNEKDADAYVIATLRNSSQLISALSKCSVMGMLRQDHIVTQSKQEVLLIRLMLHFRLLREYLFYDGIFNSSYPPIVERLSLLKSSMTLKDESAS